MSRIKVSTWIWEGIYINHLDGNTSVYAHLKISSSIEKKVRNKQYNAESFEIELFLNPEELAVSKNQIIGFQILEVHLALIFILNFAKQIPKNQLTLSSPTTI